MRTAEDIDALFAIQEGQCYFTGAPLSRHPPNYAIDHLTPVAGGGSSWPGNLALVLKEVNHRKHILGRLAFLNLLANERGATWRRERLELCKKIDRARSRIDKARRLVVRERVKSLEKELIRRYPDRLVTFGLVGDYLVLGVGWTDVHFPKGFVRKAFDSGMPEYLSDIAKSVFAFPAKKTQRTRSQVSEGTA